MEERKRRWAAKKSGTNVQEDEKSKMVAELVSQKNEFLES